MSDEKLQCTDKRYEQTTALLKPFLSVISRKSGDNDNMFLHSQRVYDGVKTVLTNYPDKEVKILAELGALGHDFIEEGFPELKEYWDNLSISMPNLSITQLHEHLLKHKVTLNNAVPDAHLGDAGLWLTEPPIFTTTPDTHAKYLAMIYQLTKAPRYYLFAELFDRKEDLKTLGYIYGSKKLDTAGKVIKIAEKIARIQMMLYAFSHLDNWPENLEDQFSSTSTILTDVIHQTTAEASIILGLPDLSTLNSAIQNEYFKYGLSWEKHHSSEDTHQVDNYLLSMQLSTS